MTYELTAAQTAELVKNYRKDLKAIVRRHFRWVARVDAHLAGTLDEPLLTRSHRPLGDRAKGNAYGLGSSIARLTGDDSIPNTMLDLARLADLPDVVAKYQTHRHYA